MNKDAVLKRITNFSVSEVQVHVQLCSQMRDYVKVLRKGEIEACRHNLNSTSALFPEDFTDAMKDLDVEVRPYEKMLKEIDWYEEALNNQQKKLKQKQ